MHEYRKITATDEVYMQITDRKLLKSRMKRLDLSQRELATMCGWKSHTLLGRIISGKVNTVEDKRAIRMAFILGVGVDDLFEAKASRVTQPLVAKRAANRPVTRVAA